MKLSDTQYSKEQFIEITQKYMIQPYQRFPFIAESAQGQYIYDTDGKRYLDFCGGVAVMGCGHSDKEINEAIIEQLRQAVHVSNYPYSIPQTMLAQFMCEHIGMDKILFQNSGTEANEAMIKLARKYGVDKYGPDRYEIVTALNGFHGRTMGSLSATGQPDSSLHKGFLPLLPGFVYAEFNSIDSFKAAVSDKTIAIMLEPIQGEGGVYPATEEFLRGIRRLCDENDLLLLLDEVQTGWGRLGELMGYMAYGIKPDAVAMAKGMGNGLPIGALCATKELAEAFTPGAHGSTYGGNPLCTAGALAAVKKIVSKDLSSNAARIGRYLSDSLALLPDIKEVRGKGLLIGAEFNSPVATALKMSCSQKGLLITAVNDTTIRLIPPLIITEKDADCAIAILKETLLEMAG